MKTQLIVGGGALLVGLLAGWMIRGVSTYNTHTASVANYEDWRVACPMAETKDVHCELSTDVVDRSQGTPSPVARAGLAINKDGKQTLNFMLPYGVALEAGMGLRIGKEPVKVYQYRTCNSVGCLAETPFDAALASALNNADDVSLMFAGLDGKPVSVPMSFKGYKASLAAWKSADQKRNSWFWRLWS